MEGEDEGVVRGVGMVSLGLVRSEVGGVVVEDELEEKWPGLRVEGDAGMGFGAAGLRVSDGSMALLRAHQFILSPPSESASRNISVTLLLSLPSHYSLSLL